VLNGLRAIADDASEGDWMLVHDAARPCLAPWHIEGLVRELMHDEVGGILAVPVADTLKREDSTHHIAGPCRGRACGRRRRRRCSVT
jgi:2-C-methyl-D-erythritol 4-phosphate cytidylyltransferase